MSDTGLAAVDAALLCMSEARERAEQAAEVALAEGNAALAEALGDAERRLHDLHGELMRAAYAPGRVETQLRLAG